MNKFILFIKTYKQDYNRTVNLLSSIDAFNKEKIPVYVSVNDNDYNYFKYNLINDNIHLLKDSEIIHCSLADGWRYQQVIKSSVYRLGECENYLSIDADSEFIRPFYLNDFMYDESTPYTIMHESKSFLEMAENINIERVFFLEALEAVRNDMKTYGKNWDYGPSPYLWSCKVWQHFNEHYLSEKNISFEDYLNNLDKLSPSECVIYGEYLRKTKLFDIIPIENYFKVYHYKKQFELEKKYFNKEKLSKTYMGIIIQSNIPVRKKKFGLF